MNIQTSPAEIRTATARFPATAEEPIRSQFLPEDRLRALGESLARGDVSDLAGLQPFDFQKRIRAVTGAPVYIAERRGKYDSPRFINSLRGGQRGTVSI